ncbi:hypothetical protein HU200_018191 [Digitaria exilis]|uniref:Uncharacterized protein n=1 Tax=Digitaria exilis TaxID=1010633 RepID=A0A835KIC3_9POAL|nr:hypothetical protein HU200_018191 [Digitaria exilis]
MALNKPSNNMCKVALIVAVLLLASQIMPSHGSPLVANSRIYLLQRFSLLSHSDESIKGTVTPGTTPPDGAGNGAAGGGVLGRDTRATDPGHSPGAGHAATNNGVGRKLLGVN